MSLSAFMREELLLADANTLRRVVRTIVSCPLTTTEREFRETAIVRLLELREERNK